MATHLQNTCPMEFVECEYQILGCSELVRRKAMDEHLTDDKYVPPQDGHEGSSNNVLMPKICIHSIPQDYT